MNKTILVYGWYYKNNIGDNLFIEAFQYLFTDLNFIFTDNITKDSLSNISAVFIGAGSFLNERPHITDEALSLLDQYKIFYIGVGVETDIHPIHLQLMAKAKFIAIRSNDLEKIKQINNNSIIISDIVYSLQDKIFLSKTIDKSVLVIPNICVVPGLKSEQWKHAAWMHFKIQFAQFLDLLIEQKYTINFLSMCQSNDQHDRGAAIEIINMMSTHKNDLLIPDNKYDIKSISSTISRYSVVITQRYHGHVLSNMVGVPNISIYHHNKLKLASNISFYETSKNCLIEKINNIKVSDILPIDRNVFKLLQQTVMDLI